MTDLLKTRYSAIDIGALGGNESSGGGINVHGHVVGGAEVSRSTADCHVQHAFIWIDGRITDLDPCDSSQSVAHALNNKGAIVGIVDTPTAGRRAYAWKELEPVTLCQCEESRFNCSAFSINDKDQIVGMVDRPHSNPVLRRQMFQAHAAFWQAGEAKLLDPETYSLWFAKDINNRRQVVGRSRTGAFLWDGGVITDLYLSSRLYGEAMAINDRGEIVGWGEKSNGHEHAFHWSQGKITDLGTLGGRDSLACDINESGVVVGQSDIPQEEGDPYITHGFIWHKGILVDLNNLLLSGADWIIERASAINEKGQIAATGIRDGIHRALRLDPVE